MKPIIINIPGSKSQTNRAIVMASLADGRSTIVNYSPSNDSRLMIEAMEKLGVRIIVGKNRLIVYGNGGVFKKTNADINVGNAGTVTRFLTAIKAIVPGEIVLIKSDRMKERPIKELEEALKTINDGKTTIRGDISSQFISALMMIAPTLRNGLEINIVGGTVSSSYIKMTADLMKEFGVEAKFLTNKIIIKKQKYRAINYYVEPDASGASYFFAIAAITKKSIRVNVSPKTNQADVKFVDILAKMGCRVEKNFQKGWIEVEGRKKLNGINVDMTLMPDTAQTLAVVVAFADGESKITGLKTLKIKETDRLVALKNELKKIGIESEIGEDWIVVKGSRAKGAIIDTYDDHRMAMAFAVAKAKIPQIIVKNPSVVEKSFPDFWEKFSVVCPQNIILIGFMGSGKTTVAKILAKRLKMTEYEMDDMVVRLSKRRSVKEIFEKDGETRFRELEIRAAKKLRKKTNAVISTGGGVVINKIIIDYLKENGKVVLLDTSFDEILKRLASDTDRPLFKDKIAAKKLYDFRRQLYFEYADLIVKTDGRSLDDIVYKIIRQK
jgi:3-phosphoshikimate 1-carboxyvinyltransferase